MARLPEYERPPIVESALAIEFGQIPSWNVVHYGLLWEEFRSDYPQVEVHPHIAQLLPPQIPNLLASPPIRCFFINSEGTQLVQIRDGAFVHNWRIQPESSLYPRYHTIRPVFERDLAKFYDFLVRNNMPPVEVWKCEVTYVNHFMRGREWSDVSDLLRTMPIFSPPNGRSGMLAEPTRLQFILNYDLPAISGNLQIQFVPAVNSEGRELAQLSITAFGKPRTSDLPDVMDWIDGGRNAVVHAFSEFTAEHTQKGVWGRIWP